MTQPVAIGLIVGHGYTKIQGPGGTTCFPSVAAPAPTHEGHLVDAPLGAPRTSVVTLDDGSEWIAGAVALSTAPNRLVSILDRARYSSPSFVALAREALHQVMPGPTSMRVLTGMPAAWFADITARQQLAEAVRPRRCSSAFAKQLKYTSIIYDIQGCKSPMIIIVPYIYISFLK